MSETVNGIIEQSGRLRASECLACDVCCRFPKADSLLAPFFSHEERVRAAAAGMPGNAFLPGRYGVGGQALLCAAERGFLCPGFNAAMNGCKIYAERPLDCRLYPFMLMYEAGGGGVWLGVDEYCPVMTARREEAHFRVCVERLAEQLDGPLVGEVVARSGIVSDWPEHVKPLRRLGRLSAALCGTRLGLARLAPSARAQVEPFFEAHGSGLLAHTFASVAAWGDVFSLYWKVCNERLLIFAEGDGDCFLIVPPLGRGDVRQPAAEALRIMRALCPHGASPRIQEADENIRAALAGNSWRVRETAVEYTYLRKELAELRGQRYEKKRQMCNRFEHDRAWVWRPYVSEDFPVVTTLYRRWLDQRLRAYPEEFFHAQAEASFRAVTRALRVADALGLTARVLEADGSIAGLTAGMGLHDRRSLGILFEVTDLSVRGAAQFIFREFCREMTSFEYVNAGGASGLESLAQTKQSYRPFHLVASSVLMPDRGHIGA